ncbi:HNH endonuclease signature motif containing protein, partial [Jiangella asiatica]
MFEEAFPPADLLVARDPRTGEWVSYEPWELPDDVPAAHGLLPDGWLEAPPPAWTPPTEPGSQPAQTDPAQTDPAQTDPAQTDPAQADLPQTDPASPHSAQAHPVQAGGIAPGPDLARLLAGTDLATVDVYDVVELAAGWQRLISWAQAEQARVLAELTGRPELRPGQCGYRSVNPVTTTALEVAARTVATTRQAENLVGHAVQLVQDFPATWAALAAGRLDERRARVITGELGGQDLQVRRRVEAAVLPVAPELDSVMLRRKITQLLHELAPVQAEQRCRAARERRDVTITPAPDAMAYLEAYLPAEDAIAVKTVLDAAAHTLHRDDHTAGRPARTAAQRRADALAALAWTALDTQHIGTAHSDRTHPTDPAPTCNHRHRTGSRGCISRADNDNAASTSTPATGAAGAGTGASTVVPVPLATAHGRPVTVHVTFAFRSLVGLTDEPGHLDGYGPIPAHLARHLAAAGTWQWVGTHPATGQVLDHGTTRYRPPQALIDHVILRDRTCRTPGCHHTAIRCDIDHRIAHGDGGPTSACNCQLLCRHHHLLKHHTSYAVTRLVNGTTRWTSPTGHTYDKPPEPIGPTT